MKIKLLFIFSALVATMTAWADSVNYIDADGKEKSVEATVLTGGGATTLGAGWYVATGPVNYTGTVTLSGDVHLILADGATMNIGSNGNRIDGHGIARDGTPSLTIYGQTDGTGALNVYITGSEHFAFILNAITINGGSVTANTNGDFDIAYNVWGDVTINGGNVEATATGANSWGINTGNITINGGIVNASANGGGIGSASNIILGWTKYTDRITSNSYFALGSITVAKALATYDNDHALVSSGNLSDISAIEGKTLVPAAPYLDADGKTHYCTDYALLEGGSGATLNSTSGWYVATGTINYTGTVTLGTNVNLILADYCQMNIGSSEDRIDNYGIYSNGNKTLTVYGQSNGHHMGILSVYTNGEGIQVDYLTINGGHVIADTEGEFHNAIYGTGTGVTINGGIVEAAATGNGSNAINTNGNFIYAGGTVTTSTDIVSAIIAGGYSFTWRNPGDQISFGPKGFILSSHCTATFGNVFTDGTNTYSSTLTGFAFNVLAGKTLTPYGYSLTANEADGNYWTKFYSSQSGFSIETADAYAYMAKYTRDDTTNPATETLTLTKLGTDIPAGTAVVIASATSPVTLAINGKLGEYTGDNDLKGEDVRTSLDDIKTTRGDGTFYVMGKKGDDFGFFKYTGDDMPARKAYLLIDGDGDALANGLKMVFDDETTSLTPVPSPKGEGSDYWYTLSGTRLSAQPTQPGLYIHGNKKVVIK